MAGATTEAQQIFFGREFNFSSDMDARSNRLRDAYNAGQRCFRFLLEKRRRVTADDLNDMISMPMHDTDREGFMMGWQSDAYAVEHGLPLSVLGGDRWEPEDKDRGHFAKDEGRNVLA